MTRRQLLLGCAGLAATAAACKPRRPAAPGSSKGSGPSGPLRDWLVADTVYHDDFVRPLLYTWTRSEQVEELARHRRLLTRDRASDGSQSLFDRSLDEVIAGGHDRDRIARTLQHPGFLRKRFAWANLWATRLGWGEADYGSHLIRVELHERAWIGSFDARAREPWSFHDLAGRVPLAYVRAHPERIGAIYHQHTSGPGELGPPFREYVLCNEAMIAEYQLGTITVARDVSWAIELLTLLRQVVGPAEALLDGCRSIEEWRASVTADWRVRAAANTLVQRYHGALALSSPVVRLERRNLDALLRALHALPEARPLIHRPAAELSRRRPQRPPPIRKHRCLDPTMCPQPASKRPVCLDPTLCP